MKNSINIHAAKSTLSQLIERVGNGEDIIISKAGKPVAKLIPFRQTKTERKFGLMKGRIRIAKDFDAPLPEELLAEFER